MVWKVKKKGGGFGVYIYNPTFLDPFILVFRYRPSVTSQLAYLTVSPPTWTGTQSSVFLVPPSLINLLKVAELIFRNFIQSVFDVRYFSCHHSINQSFYSHFNDTIITLLTTNPSCPYRHRWIYISRYHFPTYWTIKIIYYHTNIDFSLRRVLTLVDVKRETFLKDNPFRNNDISLEYCSL